MIEAVIQRHERIALQFSGGRDSLALVYLMRPFWDRLTIYHVNAGAPFPETAAIVEHVRQMVPNFVYIMGRQPQVIAEHGMPSDLVPAANTAMGQFVSGDADRLRLQDRYSCCWRSLMEPMQERMAADGITLIVRGQRTSESLKSRYRSGDVVDGIELLQPIEGWSDDDVMAYLEQQQAPVSPVYQVMRTSHECMNCTAYLELGVNEYLREHHQLQWRVNQRRLATIYNALLGPVSNFNREFDLAHANGSDQ